MDDRCCVCQTFRYFDINFEGEQTADGAYVCPSCVRSLDGKRAATHAELMRFLKDPDEIHRLEARVKDLETIVATTFRDMAA